MAGSGGERGSATQAHLKTEAAAASLGKSDGEMIHAEAPSWALWKPDFALDHMAEFGDPVVLLAQFN